MKNVQTLLVGALFFAGALDLFGQQVSFSEAMESKEKTMTAELTPQDQQKPKAPPPDYVKYDVAPEVVKQIQPEYPDEAMKKNIEGTVWLQLLIGEEGKVIDVKVQKSDAEVFNQAAAKAGMQWLFKPAMLNGKPIQAWVSVPFRFKLMTGTGVVVSPTTGATKAQEKHPPADYVPYEKPPEAIKQVMPVYPEGAKKDKLEGTVWVQLLIGEEGKVTDVKVQKSDAEVFNQAAMKAATQWLFKPAMLNGKPTQVWVSVPFRFKLQEKASSAPAVGSMKAKNAPPAEDLKADKYPEVIKQVNPKYPEKATQEGIEGTVWTKMWIDEAGNVVEVKIAKTERAELNEAAIDAGKQWKFKPALIDGKPVAVWITVPFRFKLSAK